jgi:3-hydroxyisobutyrate dehydrogenase-like beta-hydroxyacid dehydrogenase
VNLAFIGLGVMGPPMAGHLAAMKAGALFVDYTTVSASIARDLAAPRAYSPRSLSPG